MSKAANDKKFIPKSIDSGDLESTPKIDLAKLYEQAHGELTLQQTKRDHIITLFISIFSLLIPFALSLDGLSIIAKGLIFIAVSVIGIMFSVIVIRYRIYKDIYWLCCETITCLMNLKETALGKDMAQAFFYNSLCAKGKNFCKNKDTEQEKWSFPLYVKKNIISSETLHFMIVDLMTSVLGGLGLFLILTEYLLFWTAVAVGIAVGAALFLVLLYYYFRRCESVYAVMKDGKDSSFNGTFEKAWFLHFYVDEKNLGKKLTDERKE